MTTRAPAVLKRRVNQTKIKTLCRNTSNMLVRLLVYFYSALRGLPSLEEQLERKQRIAADG